jgi:hypothetical protein
MPEPPETVHLKIIDERRLAALESVATIYKSLDVAPPEEQNQRMAQYFADCPEFEASGASPTSVWARFTDGQFVIMENQARAYAPAPISAQRSSEPPPNVVGGIPPEISSIAPATPSDEVCVDPANVPSASEVSGETTPSGVPGTNVACLCCYGTEDWIVSVKEWLTAYKYDVHIFDATVENLRRLPTCAVLAMDAHGDYSVSPTEGLVYGVMTTTAVTLPALLDYAEDLAKGYLAYYYHYGDLVPPFHFAITAKFVAAYWKFDDNAFVYLSTCRGFHKISEGFRQAVLHPGGDKKGASVYASWTQRSPSIPVAHLYLFDRLLGANAGSWEGRDGEKLWQAHREEPPQRPFDWLALDADMRRKGLYRWDAKYSGMSMVAFDNSGPGDFGLLRPSIRRVHVNEAEQPVRKLIIEGLFGLPPYRSVKVTIGGNDLGIDESLSGNKRIVCPGLPASAYGDVVVVINGLESNHVPLTCWSADANFSVTGPGDLKAAVTVNIRLRGDVHDFREEPGRSPERFQKQIWTVEEHVAIASYKAEGTFAAADFDVSWSAAQMANYANVVCYCAGENYMFAPDGNPMSIRLAMQMTVPYKQHLRWRDTGQEFDGEVFFESAGRFFDVSGRFPMTLTERYDIGGSGQLQKSANFVQQLVEGDWCANLEWTTFTVDFAPLDEEGEQIPA